MGYITKMWDVFWGNYQHLYGPLHLPKISAPPTESTCQWVKNVSLQCSSNFTDPPFWKTYHFWWGLKLVFSMGGLCHCFTDTPIAFWSTPMIWAEVWRVKATNEIPRMTKWHEITKLAPKEIHYIYTYIYIYKCNTIYIYAHLPWSTQIIPNEGLPSLSPLATCDITLGYL